MGNQLTKVIHFSHVKKQQKFFAMPIKLVLHVDVKVEFFFLIFCVMQTQIQT